MATPPFLMTVQQVLLLCIIIASATLYVTRWLQPELTSLLAIASLALSGVLDAQDALSGLSSSATVTVAAMFVLSAGLARTGALDELAAYLVRAARGSANRLLLLLGTSVPLASAFMNNTPVVVMMAPVLIAISGQVKVRPSKLLIPLSYFSIFGGTMTLLGTSTNILIDDLYRQAGGPGLGIFEFAPLGLIYTAVGSVYVYLFGQKLLPDTPPLASLASERQKTPYVTEILVDASSELIGQRVGALFDATAGSTAARRATVTRPRRRLQRNSKLDENSAEGGLELLQIVRNGTRTQSVHAQEMTIQNQDLLTVVGTPGAISRFLGANGARLAGALEAENQVPIGAVDQIMMEAVILPHSAYNGARVSSLNLHQRFGVQIIGLQHNQRHRPDGLQNMRLQSGDVLLLQGTAEGLRAGSSASHLLLIEGVDRHIVRAGKNRLALLIMLLVVLLATFTPLPIVVLALAGAALMVLTHCLRVDEAFQSLSADTLLMLAATIPMGVAMQSSGLAQRAVDGLLMVSSTAGPLLFLSIFYLSANLITQIISNNAVAVLFTPIALTLATTLGVSPKPLLMAIAFGASAAFMTPMGYQTNAIVMGIGGYTFSDFLRIGAPLSLIMWLVATIFIPLLWPLT